MNEDFDNLERTGGMGQARYSGADPWRKGQGHAREQHERLAVKTHDMACLFASKAYKSFI